MPLQPDPTSVLFEALRAYLLATHPRFPIDRLKLHGSDGSEIKLRVVLTLAPAPMVVVAPEAASAPIAPALATEPSRLSEMEAEVLEVLGADELTGQEIADRTSAEGYSNIPFDGNLRACLASLRRRGILTGKPGEKKYSVATPEASITSVCRDADGVVS